jgi:hypothetical protein
MMWMRDSGHALIEREREEERERERERGREGRFSMISMYL